MQLPVARGVRAKKRKKLRAVDRWRGSSVKHAPSCASGFKASAGGAFGNGSLACGLPFGVTFVSGLVVVFVAWIALG